MRSDCLYSSSHPKSSHFNPSKMELTEASVLRPTSVSSRRRIMVPPLWRAYNQLKIKVRALPTCKKPVGDGANRTRGLGGEAELIRNPFGCYGRWKSIVKLRSAEGCPQVHDFTSCAPHRSVLKSCCVRFRAVKALKRCFPQK